MDDGGSSNRAFLSVKKLSAEDLWGGLFYWGPWKIRGVIKKYGECLNLKKNYYSKRHTAINAPQNTPLCFEHTYPIIPATF
jgi:hypothetical protein